MLPGGSSESEQKKGVPIMYNRQIQLGADLSGTAITVVAERVPHTLITGGSTADREAVLRNLATAISKAGIPLFLTDTRGNLSALSGNLPCTLWDLKGTSGLPLRTTVTELGPLLLAKLLELNDKQSSLLRILFKIADENNLLLIDTKDLKALIGEVTQNSGFYTKNYGAMNKQSLQAILSAIVSLETERAGDYLFEPAIAVHDFLNTEESGTGRIHILDAREQAGERTLYAVFLLFLFGELYETLPDHEDGEGMRLVLLINEAQLFFSELSESLLAKTRQMLPGLSDKGVSVWFAAAQSNEIPDAEEITAGQILEVVNASEVRIRSIGESNGTDSSQNIILAAAEGSAKALTAKERAALCASDPLHEKYKIPFDRDSAYEFLKRRGLEAAETNAAASSETNAATISGTSSGENPATTTETPSGGTAENASSAADKDNTTAASSETTTETENVSSDASSKSKLNIDSDSLEDMAKRAKSSAKSLTSTTAGTIGRQVGKTIGSTFGSFGETLGGNIGASLGRGIVNTLFKS